FSVIAPAARRRKLRSRAKSHTGFIVIFAVWCDACRDASYMPRGQAATTRVCRTSAGHCAISSTTPTTPTPATSRSLSGTVFRNMPRTRTAKCQLLHTRRGLLSSLSFAGVAAVGGAVGYVFGSQSSTPLLSGLTDQDRKDIDELRAEAHFRRDYDGHVWVQERAGEWAEVRQDAELAGTLLVRSASGRVSFFTMGLQQIDLTDDFVVAAVFGDGSWERVLQPLKAKDDNDQVVDVVLDQDSFRELISISI
ncbi:hypothetical protein QJQ45_022484, partial [Haematococcus lacustris]